MWQLQHSEQKNSSFRQPVVRFGWGGAWYVMCPYYTYTEAVREDAGIDIIVTAIYVVEDYIIFCIAEAYNLLKRVPV